MHAATCTCTWETCLLILKAPLLLAMHEPRFRTVYQAALFLHLIPYLNPAFPPSITPLYQAALFDLLFGTRGDGSVNVASLYSVTDEEGNTALTTAWQRVTCEDGQELIRQGDDKSEWYGDLAAEVEPPLG